MERSDQCHVRSQSSDSDEGCSTRHDRFKSERFQDSSSSKLPARERRQMQTGQKYESRSHRDRSPRSHHRPNSKAKSPPSSHKRESRYQSRSSYDNRQEDKEHSSKASRSHKSETLLSSYSKMKEEIKVHKNKLSSLLRNFDKQVEEKRNLENSSQSLIDMGPALPPSLKKEEEQDDGLRISNSKVETSVGPALQPNLKDPIEMKDRHEHDNGNVEKSPTDLFENQFQNLKNDNCTGSPEQMETDSVDLHDLSLHLKENQLTSGIVQCSDSPENSVSSDQPAKTIVAHSEQDPFGPTLPPKSEPEFYGPALPPKKEPDTFGPTLLAGLKKGISIQGPALPSEGLPNEEEEEDSDDENAVGPLPEGKLKTLTQYQLELRAANIRRQLEEEKNGSTSTEDVNKREEWMLELPPEKAVGLGLGPRTFRAREGPDMRNRSAWTDTPEDRARKEQQALSGMVEPVSMEEVSRAAFVQERNEAMDEMSKLSRDKDRPRSLLELHQEKLKKKTKKEKKEGKKEERRPFDRNIDLQVNRFDDAQKKAIYKKAQLLDTRFSTGESKYL